MLMLIKRSSVLIQAVLLVSFHHAVVNATPNTTPGTVNCTDLSRNRVKGFKLVDGSNNTSTQIVTDFAKPYVIDLNQFGNCDLNVMAVLPASVPQNCDINNVRCVRFVFGDTVRRDFVPPFTVYQENDGTGRPVDRRPASGVQTLRACAYTDPNCFGPRSGCFEVEATVIACNPPIPAPVPAPAPAPNCVCTAPDPA
jgi:hypothetical protein